MRKRDVLPAALAFLLATLAGPPALADDGRVVVQGCGAPPAGSSGEPVATYVGPGDCGFNSTLDLAPGAEVSWEAGQVPPFAVISGGPIEVTLADGSKRRIPAGDVFSEVGQWRKARNPGKETVHLLLTTTPYIDIVPNPPQGH